MRGGKRKTNFFIAAVSWGNSFALKLCFSSLVYVHIFHYYGFIVIIFSWERKQWWYWGEMGTWMEKCRGNWDLIVSLCVEIPRANFHRFLKAFSSHSPLKYIVSSYLPYSSLNSLSKSPCDFMALSLSSSDVFIAHHNFYDSTYTWILAYAGT